MVKVMPFRALHSFTSMEIDTKLPNTKLKVLLHYKFKAKNLVDSNWSMKVICRISNFLDFKEYPISEYFNIIKSQTAIDKLSINLFLP